MAKGRSLEEREQISKAKRGGQDIEVLKYVTLKEAKALGYDQVLIPALGEDMYMGDLGDVEAVMEADNLSGEFVPVRRTGGLLRRAAVVKVVKSDDGFKGPVVEEEGVADA